VLKLRSIRFRLLAMLLLVMCGAWGIVTYFVFADASEEVHELFDANLSQNRPRADGPHEP